MKIEKLVIFIISLNLCFTIYEWCIYSYNKEQAQYNVDFFTDSFNKTGNWNKQDIKEKLNFWNGNLLNWSDAKKEWSIKLILELSFCIILLYQYFRNKFS